MSSCFTFTMGKAIVIGAGVGGMAAALRLRAKGFEVEVFEAEHTYGGKMASLETDGYRWDKGPSLFTLPELVDELFHLFDEDPRQYFSYHKLPIICKYFWEDGTAFEAKQEISDFVEDATATFEVDKKQIESYLAKSKKKYDLVAPIFLDSSLHQFSSYLNINTAKSLIKLPFFEIGKSLHGVNQAQLNNPKLVQLFDRYATYNGSSPYKTSGIMSLIPSLEMHQGAYFPNEGIRSIVDSLYQLAKEKGVRFHFNELVESILHDQKKAGGIKTIKGSYEADVLVSNMDVYFTYQKLLKQLKAPKKILSQEKSSSALIFYWGIKREFPELGVHNIFFAKDYESEFDALFSTKELYHDPTIYTHISSKIKKDDAPPGCENWFVMINVPSKEDNELNDKLETIKRNIISKLNRLLNVNIEPLIKVEEVFTPMMIEKNTRSHLGALYGNSSNRRNSAFLRHANFSKQLNNLYFCGGSVHPGGGIPLSLKSAKIATSLIQ